MSVPFFTSGIHLLIKARSAAAEWLSIINFILTATMAIYYNANPNVLEETWIFYTTPIFNQLFINAFDVIWSNKYRFRTIGVGLTSLLYILTLASIFSHFEALDQWIVPMTALNAIGLAIIILIPKRPEVTFEINTDQSPSNEDENNQSPQSNP
jgi:peptidoglycan/LPS O-acetylase OafA/YrhL